MFGAHRADDSQQTLTISFGWDETKQRISRAKTFVRDPGEPSQANGNGGDQEDPNAVEAGGEPGDEPRLLF